MAINLVERISNANEEVGVVGLEDDTFAQLSQFLGYKRDFRQQTWANYVPKWLRVGI